MCVAWIAYQVHPDYPIVLAANRDEFYTRPTASAAYWPDFPDIAGGRDMKDHGTWFAAHRDGRLGLLTNHRNFKLHREAPKSRGILISSYLCGNESAQNALERIQSEAADYNPFNLLLLDQMGLYHYDNVQDRITTLPPGIYGLSNAFLDTPWPKVNLGKKFFAEYLSTSPDNLEPEQFLSLLKDQTIARDEDLPSTGLELDLERQLSSIYIDAGTYGTRAHTVFTLNRHGCMSLYERSLLIDSNEEKTWRTTRLNFKTK
jgi:uncharacterized protein with NRDE domain